MQCIVEIDRYLPYMVDKERWTKVSVNIQCIKMSLIKSYSSYWLGVSFFSFNSVTFCYKKKVGIITDN